ncbi:MAG: NAD(P)-dependent oxidoreductase [Myxococcota bacterium]
MHVLIADHVAPEAKEGLEALGLEVSQQPELTVNRLPDAVGDCEILVVDETAVNRRTIERAEKLVLIVRAGAGVEGIDLQAANERAIFVAHVPGFDAAARAEHAVWSLIDLDRAGESGEGPGAEGLYGRRLGLFGYSRAAARVAEAAAGLGMDVRVFSDDLTPSLATEAGMTPVNSADDLFRRCEVISYHPEGVSGAPPVGRDQLAALGAGGLLLAVDGLGALDLGAVADAVEAGDLRVAVDAPVSGLATDQEKALAALSGQEPARITRGEAGATGHAWRQAATEVVRVVHGFLHEGSVAGCVNLCRSCAAAGSLVIRHDNQTNALSAVFDVLAEEDIRALQVTNILFGEASSAALHVRVDAMPGPAALNRIRRHQSIIHVELAPEHD